MLPSRRIVTQVRLRYLPRSIIRRAGSSTIPANDLKPQPAVQNVSETNVLPTTSTGNFDAALQESVEEGERQRARQAPNREGVWSRSQQERSTAMVGPRFEQTIMEYQVGLDPMKNTCLQKCRIMWLMQALSIAATVGSDRTYSSATCSMDPRKARLM